MKKMYKQFENLAEIYDGVAELLRACEYANISATSSQQTLTSHGNSTLKIYLDVWGQDYLIEYATIDNKHIYRMEGHQTDKKQILNELSKLTQMVEEYEICA